MLLVRTVIATLIEKPVIATPKAVPLAGGCSKSSVTINNIEMPTASAYMIIDEKAEECGIKVTSEPDMRPTTLPPITLRGLAVIFRGMVKTIKAVAPIDAIMTAFCTVRSKRTTTTTKVAKKL